MTSDAFGSKVDQFNTGDSMKLLLAVTAVSIATALPAVSAERRPADNLRELGQEISACLAPTRLSPGSEATVVFSIKRDGSLLGKPRLSYLRLPKDEAVREDDAQEIARAFAACLPIAITDALGGAIAGRPLTVRVHGRKPDREAAGDLAHAPA